MPGLQENLLFFSHCPGPAPTLTMKGKEKQPLQAAKKPLKICACVCAELRLGC